MFSTHENKEANSFVSINKGKLGRDSGFRRNSTMLENVLLERNMATWRTETLT
jgi:hypothetical protein